MDKIANGAALGGHVTRASKIISKVKSFRLPPALQQAGARIIEFGAGTVPGMGLGAATHNANNEKREKDWKASKRRGIIYAKPTPHTMRRDIIQGGITTGALTSAFHHLHGQSNARRADHLNDWGKELHEGHKEFYDKVINGDKNINAAKYKEEQLYNEAFNGKMDSRTISEMAEVEANRQSAKKYHDKFIKAGPMGIDIGGDKNKIFGHFRRGGSGFNDLMRKLQERESLKFRHNSQLKTEQMFSGLRRKNGPTMYGIRDLSGVETNPKSVEYSSDFKNKIRDIEAGAKADAKSGHKYDYFDKARANAERASKSNISEDEFNSYHKLFGSDLRKMTTKAEFDRAFKKAAMKYHPDINKAPNAAEMMAHINDAKAKIHSSDFYEKLAGFNMGMEKVSFYHNYIVHKTVKERE